MTEQTSEQTVGEKASLEAASTEKTSAIKTGAVKTSDQPVARTRRPGKPKVDPVLADAVEFAHDALYEITDPAQVGAHLGVTAEGDRLLTHRFAAAKPGYRGWEWFVTVARAPRVKKVTVCEIGLLPGEDALIAPPWVPWLERMNDEEKQAHKAEQAEADEG
ncbi:MULTISPECIES: DUF3027 domain-containing protein [unclassified Nesterenkonia]|uniref:DUF3027 domain-containing protein n=1 Tax=unclassified Nesterenkonia TaxID=2629769 RepID=UPI001F4C64ED|nr:MULTISPECIES: DUF3027 domain-containing protein [unclassified Nesterenkonia]MCH8560669.1 DUF3027 domain-containing protein [Nesterenkonia sp. DZ6]MCH8570777.1 DUF3027 domain-containing protein [Nesterenkonia sp. AY15]